MDFMENMENTKAFIGYNEKSEVAYPCSLDWAD